YLFVFFFQAEDGIRDPLVTGVQTCALPISDQARQFALAVGDSAWVGVRRIHALLHPGLSFLIVSDAQEPLSAAVTVGGELARLRSEERRVGKGWGDRGWRKHEEKRENRERV